MRDERKKLLKYWNIQNNSNCVYLHDYCSNNEILHNFSSIDVSDFGAWMCKIEPLCYFVMFDANVLSMESVLIQAPWTGSVQFELDLFNMKFV